MSTDTLTAIGDIIAGIGVVIAGASVIVGAFFGRRAARDSRQAAEQGRLSVDLGRQAAEQGRQAIEQGRPSATEARTARRVEHLYRDLDRQERMAVLVKRMWGVVNKLSTSADSATAGFWPASQEMDGLLYDLRAVLMMFGRDEMPRCTELAGHDGRTALGAGTAIQAADDEVRDAITRSREALVNLA